MNWKSHAAVHGSEYAFGKNYLFVRIPLHALVPKLEVPIRCLFTAREKEIANLLIAGLRNKEMARTLNVSESAVKHHIGNLFTKLKVTSRFEAMQKLAYVVEKS